MKIFKFNNCEYKVDSYGFLIDTGQWDENFAKGVAAELNLTGGLKDKHWKIIYFIRDYYKKANSCPIVYETCKQNNLSLHDLKELFPAGYQRGACRISGITFNEGFLRYHSPDKSKESDSKAQPERTYIIDKYGFLVNYVDWDEDFAVLKSVEMKMPKLNDSHWKVINYLRNKYQLTKKTPTIYEVCEENNLNIEEFNNLFPDGYHRGALKLSGLRLF